MNFDGQTPDNNGVDGRNINPFSVSAEIGRFNALRYNVASQSDPLSGAINYTLPVVSPPNSTTQRYAVTTPVYSDGGFIITDASNNVWEAQLLITPFLANFAIPFANNTRYTSQQIFGTINAAIAAQIASWPGITSVVTLSMNNGFNPYRTNVTVTGAGTLSLGNYFPPSFSEKYLGIGIAFPPVGPNQTVVSSSNAFTTIAGTNQLRWTPIA
jgi:hypothetical protein